LQGIKPQEQTNYNMKNIKYIIIAIVLLAAGTAFGAIASYTYTSVKNATILNSNYFDDNNYKVFRFEDNSTTCYTVEYEVYRGVNNQRNVSLSCVK
jgi:hypothetical protein